MINNIHLEIKVETIVFLILMKTILTKQNRLRLVMLKRYSMMDLKKRH